jgi:membrane protein implicated in regulation of membrane protease activity
VIVVWVLVAALLLAVELHHLAFFACFGAAGALAAAAVAVAAPDAVVLQVGVGVGVAAVGIAAVRPYVSKAFARSHDGAVIHGVHGGLIGARGTTIDEVPFGTYGHIRLLGETWLAVAADEKSIAPATPVIVTAVTGTTLTVKSTPTRELQ